MNIFYLDENLSECAKAHMDRHIVKMPIETCQLLSNAYWLTNDVGLYRLTHKGHPCTKWVMESLENFEWLAELGLELCKEYAYRYGRTHACEVKIDRMGTNPPVLPRIPMTPHALCMPAVYKSDCPITSYRNYYRGEKPHLAKWKNREKPEWY